MQEYKLYYNCKDLHMIRITKYLEKEIIIICNEVKTEEPNFYFQAHYTIDDLIEYQIFSKIITTINCMNLLLIVLIVIMSNYQKI